MRSSAFFLRPISSRWLQECSITEQLAPTAQALGPIARTALQSVKKSSTCTWSTRFSINCIRDRLQDTYGQEQYEVMHRYCKPFWHPSRRLLCVHRRPMLLSRQTCTRLNCHPNAHRLLTSKSMIHTPQGAPA